MTMRTVLWLSIAVFVSSLFWPQLLNYQDIIVCLVVFVLLLTIRSIRILAVIPLSAVYFTFYANLTLTGSLPYPVNDINLPLSNSFSLQETVDGQDHNIVVQVSSLISPQNQGYFRANLIELDGNHLNYSPLLEMRWYKPTLQVHAGQIHSFRASFKPVYGRANPGGFDRQKWSFSEHTAYQVTIKEHLQEISSDLSSRGYFYQKVKQVSEALPQQGILLALSFADKSLITIEQKELITKLGISHLFAISGLHIGLLFSFVYLLLHFLVNAAVPRSCLGWASWRLVNAGALAAALFYAYLAGFSLPTQRAFLMLLFAVLVLSMKRKCAFFDLIAMTLFIILLWDPLAVLSLSLWLSFSAVCLIVAVLWRFPKAEKSQVKSNTHKLFYNMGAYLKLLCIIQLGLTLLMIPIQLLSFSAFSVLAPLINLIAVPLFSLLIIPLTLLGALLSLFSEPAALLLFYCADQLITLFFLFLRQGASAYQVFSLAQSNVIILFVLLSIVLSVVYFHGPVQRRIGFVCVVLMLSFVLLYELRSERDSQSKWFVEVFDVGQGLAVLLRSAGQSLLYDSGPRYPSGFTTAVSEIYPYLKLSGVKNLDYLIISHSDIDHAGGFSVINREFKPKHILLGEPLSENEPLPRNSRLCQAGQKRQLGSLSIEVLSPFLITKKNNNNSCVLRITDGFNSLLLTGDIEKKQELLLVREYGDRLKSDLLLAPHHGSKYSSSEAFIKAVDPQRVIYSVGFMNHWGFPAQEVKLRYKKQGVMSVNSGLSGFIRFNIEKQYINMQTYREDLASYWYHQSLSLSTY
ncbi:DNA internalization-related competence protein ComEC/Rec2 [Psychromonas aquimarina]|uniref:DNA internalization-related competence protein ComEC/Rec2 n=1 Tax=Psychromonas aquimarina TaxID=444919 RepID=UPI000428F874|nr:DNA internalization-related competence protein ComEC/Rec2 [Psychromonas aquimarina]